MVPKAAPPQRGCVVCGFEAFIGDKHVVGVVKEKSQDQIIAENVILAFVSNVFCILFLYTNKILEDFDCMGMCLKSVRK